MKLTYSYFALSFMYLFIVTCNNEVPEYLNFDLSTVNHIEIDSVGEYEYIINIKGDDPYIFLKGLSKPLSKKQTVLTFEYSSNESVNFLEIYFLSRETGSFGSNIAGIQKNPGLEPTDGMTVYSIDLGESIENYNWDSKTDWLRVDFGDRSNAQIVIRDIHFRERNNTENALFLEKEAFKDLDKQVDEKFSNYLSNTYESLITRVEVYDSTILVEGNYLLDNGEAMLYAVKPWENIIMTEQFEGKVLPPAPFSFEMERYVNIDEFIYDQALSKWIIVREDKFISAARYPDYIKPIQNMLKKNLIGRKGIGGFHINRGHTSDLTDFPATSITVNTSITSFMYHQERENTIAHTYGGKTYYFDNTYVEGLDRTMREALKHDIIVAAIILINPASKSADPVVGKLLQHKDFGGENAFYTMPNMATLESVHCYAAALDFLASRYNRVDNKYGRIHHWIIHNEVDAGNIWTNMGKNRPLHVFLDAYYKSMRLCYNIARQYDKNSEVFASFTHSWAKPVPVDGDYATLDMLNGLLNYSKVEGDFKWGLAYHPYPEDLSEPKTWNDEAATFTMNSPMVTFKNLEVLDKWIKLPENKYLDTQKRTLWLSESGTNSRSYSEQDLVEQAAGFAYAWKKLKNLDGIDAFQWHNWIDSRSEFGLRLGLRKFPRDKIDPAGKKPVWYLYQAADTPWEDKIFDQYKSIIGISDWSEILHEVK